MNITDNQLKAIILDKLARHTYWGGKHTSFDNLQKGIPKYLSGHAKKLGEGMIKTGLLLAKPTSYGLEVSLNPVMKKEIFEIIDKYL
ncbi:MAG: hypothetical protein J4473_04055 [Candidatus Aenigmarchaeota archaeon]|nr:hypothetical protein [Candidatus Aenigmarchaeota archaeon]